MLSSYQLKIGDFCKFPIGTVQKLMLKFFDKKVCTSKKCLKIAYGVLEFNQSQWLNPYFKLNTQKE